MKYFTIQELCKSSTAEKYHISNTPSPEIQRNLISLVERILDPLREALGKPVFVSSGYRSEQLNEKVGGSKTSQHMMGEAADLYLKTGSNLEIAKKILELHLPYDQLILEKGDITSPSWIHVSYSDRQRRQCMYFNGKKYLRCSEDLIKRL